MDSWGEGEAPVVMCSIGDAATTEKWARLCICRR